MNACAFLRRLPLGRLLSLSQTGNMFGNEGCFFCNFMQQPGRNIVEPYEEKPLLPAIPAGGIEF